MPGKGRPPQAIPSPISRHIITCYVRYQGSKHTVIYILVQTIMSVQAKLDGKSTEILTCVWFAEVHLYYFIVHTYFPIVALKSLATMPFHICRNNTIHPYMAQCGTPFAYASVIRWDVRDSSCALTIIYKCLIIPTLPYIPYNMHSFLWFVLQLFDLFYSKIFLFCCPCGNRRDAQVSMK